MEHNAKNICKTVISGKEQNLNKKNGRIWKFNAFSILIVPWGSPGYRAWKHCTNKKNLAPKRRGIVQCADV